MRRGLVILVATLAVACGGAGSTLELDVVPEQQGGEVGGVDVEPDGAEPVAEVVDQRGTDVSDGGADLVEELPDVTADLEDVPVEPDLVDVIEPDDLVEPDEIVEPDLVEEVAEADVVEDVAEPDVVEDVSEPEDVEPDICVPDCGGLECGDDGCGGSCGECGDDEQCVAGLCECLFVPCGDGCCDEGEVCAEGQCCTPDCTGKECGDDGCGGSCGSCDAGCSCGGGQCLGSCGPCLPDCTGKACGWDGCGGSCGECAANESCNTVTWQCDPGACSLPTTFAPDAFKLNSLKAGEDGSMGQGLDVDNDPATCAPANACEAGIDNSFGALMKSLMPFLGGSEPLMDAVETGDIVMVVELVEPVLDGSPFMANIFRADPVLPVGQCDFQAELCDYTVDPSSFVPESCLAVTAFDNVQAAGNIITAGGPQYAFEFPFVLALTGGQEVLLPASHAKMVAELELDDQGNILAMSGIIACAVPKAAIIAMVNDIPENALPVSKDLIITVLEMVVTADIDADGDGTLEAVSTGMLFTAIPGNLVGVTP